MHRVAVHSGATTCAVLLPMGSSTFAIATRLEKRFRCLAMQLVKRADGKAVWSVWEATPSSMERFMGSSADAGSLRADFGAESLLGPFSAKASPEDCGPPATAQSPTAASTASAPAKKQPRAPEKPATPAQAALPAGPPPTASAPSGGRSREVLVPLVHLSVARTAGGVQLQIDRLVPIADAPAVPKAARAAAAQGISSAPLVERPVTQQATSGPLGECAFKSAARMAAAYPCLVAGGLDQQYLFHAATPLWHA